MCVWLHPWTLMRVCATGHQVPPFWSLGALLTAWCKTQDTSMMQCARCVRGTRRDMVEHMLMQSNSVQQIECTRVLVQAPWLFDPATHPQLVAGQIVQQGNTLPLNFFACQPRMHLLFLYSYPPSKLICIVYSMLCVAVGMTVGLLQGTSPP